MRRTLQTAILASKDVIYRPVTNPRGLKIIAWPELREKFSNPSCTGSPLSKILEYFDSDSDAIDLNLVTDEWMYNGETGSGYERKADNVRHGLWQLGQEALVDGRWKGLKLEPRMNSDGNVEILVATHSVFIEALVMQDRSK